MSDSVCSPLAAEVESHGAEVVRVDLDHVEEYEIMVDASEGATSITGRDLRGDRPVTSIFFRTTQVHRGDVLHGRRRLEVLAKLYRAIDLASCEVANRPSCSLSNYSKPFQLEVMRSAGFKVPLSLITNDVDALASFWSRHADAGTIVKGISNVPTLVRHVDKTVLSRARDRLADCPSLFQEAVGELDLRVHVVGDHVFGSAIHADDSTDYRRSLRVPGEVVNSKSYIVPTSAARACVEVTAGLGLAVSGLDFRVTAAGELIALELNPYPLYSFYEARDGNPITATVARHLIASAQCDRQSNLHL